MILAIGVGEARALVLVNVFVGFRDKWYRLGLLYDLFDVVCAFQCYDLTN